MELASNASAAALCPSSPNRLPPIRAALLVGAHPQSPGTLVFSNGCAFLIETLLSRTGRERSLHFGGFYFPDTFFVRAYSTVEIDMPAGNPELRYACGSTWYGESKLFGDSTRYAKDEEYYDFTNYTWEISLYTTSNAGSSMDVEYIDANDF